MEFFWAVLKKHQVAFILLHGNEFQYEERPPKYPDQSDVDVSYKYFLEKYIKKSKVIWKGFLINNIISFILFDNTMLDQLLYHHMFVLHSPLRKMTLIY